MDSERERRMAVLGPHVFDGVPLAQAAADAGVPVGRQRGGWSPTQRTGPPSGRVGRIGPSGGGYRRSWST